MTQPISEQYRVAALKWADLENAAYMLESTKNDVLAEMKAKVVAASNEAKMPDNKAERIVRASPEWNDYRSRTAAAKHQARLARIEVEYLKMRFNEWQSSHADRRAEMRLTA